VFFRGYALDQQEPISRNSLFLRRGLGRCVHPEIGVIGLCHADLLDGSGRIQLAADYLSVRRMDNRRSRDRELGGRHSDFGSLSPDGALWSRSHGTFDAN